MTTCESLYKTTANPKENQQTTYSIDIPIAAGHQSIVKLTSRFKSHNIGCSKYLRIWHVLEESQFVISIRILNWLEEKFIHMHAFNIPLIYMAFHSPTIPRINLEGWFWIRVSVWGKDILNVFKALVPTLYAVNI